MPETPEERLARLTDQVWTVVKAVNGANPNLLRENTTESCGTFTELVVEVLHEQVNANYGHVKKTGAQTQYRGHAVDALMYRDPKQVWDIIGGAENHPQAGTAQANPAEHGGQGWLDPDDLVIPGTPPAPQPPTPAPAPDAPVTSLHLWIHDELPRLVAEFHRKHPELAGQPGVPGWEWVSFTTYRRFVERWPFDRVFAEV
jgi:hypothetical protein